MEKEDFITCISSAEEAKNLIIRLAGNLQNAEKILSRSKSDDEEYSKVALAIDDSDVVSALHGLEYTAIILQNAM